MEDRSKTLAMTDIILSSERFRNSVSNAFKKNPSAATEFSEERLRNIVHTAYKEIGILEELGKQQEQAMKNHELDSTLKEIGAILTPSGPGLIEEPFKEDSYNGLEWAAFMGRRRLMISAFYMRRIAEVRAGIRNLEGIDLSRNDERTKELITECGPTLLFNGRSDENTDVEEYLVSHRVIVPSDKVKILKGQIKNTVDQIRNLKEGEGQAFLQGLPPQSLALITHAPHAVRLLHLMGNNNPFPPNLNVMLFPIPTSPKAEEAKLFDISGLAYYQIVGEASEKPFVPSNVDFSISVAISYFKII